MACTACIRARRQMLAAVRAGNGPGVVQAVRLAGSVNLGKLRAKFQQDAARRKREGKP